MPCVRSLLKETDFERTVAQDVASIFSDEDFISSLETVSPQKYATGYLHVDVGMAIE